MIQSSGDVPQGKLPIGTIMSYGGSLNVEAFEKQGWLYCNGNAIGRDKYSDLFKIIGTSYGSGDQKSTFNLPDFRGTFLRGVSGDTTNDPDAGKRGSLNGGNTGNKVGSVQAFATGMPVDAITSTTNGSHSHSVPHIPKDNSSYAIAGSYQAIWNSGGKSINSAGAHTHEVTGGGDAESRPVNVYTYFLIKFAHP
ncbi:MAG: tail fiber protein [Cytophagales bacterium]|nr:tail fiber protein [Cytophagales bacterium]